MSTQDYEWEYFTGEEAIKRGLLQQSDDQYKFDENHWKQIAYASGPLWDEKENYRRRKQPETVPTSEWKSAEMIAGGFIKPDLHPWQIAMNEVFKGANQITINENSDLFRMAFEAGVKYAKEGK